MVRLPRLNIMLALALLALSACQSSAPPQAVPKISFTRFQPIYLDVSRIDITDEYQMPMQTPNIEHLMSMSPTEAMHIWVKDRLRAVGADKTLQVIIKDASVKAQNLPKPGGITGFFTNSQDQRFDARLEVELRIYGRESAMSEASISIQSERSISIAERASAADREVALRRLLFELMEAANAELEKNIFQYFGNSINYSHNP